LPQLILKFSKLFEIWQFLIITLALSNQINNKYITLYNNKEKSRDVFNKKWMKSNAKMNVELWYFLAMISKKMVKMAMAIMTIVAAACFGELMLSCLMTKNFFSTHYL